MRYTDIAPEYTQYIDIEEDEFNALPERAQHTILNLAKRIYDTLMIEFIREHREDNREYTQWRSVQDIVGTPIVALSQTTLEPTRASEDVDYYLQLHSKYTLD